MGSSMQRIPSPYNFVPQSDQVVLPDWGELISHDVPFRDGISGSFDVEVTAETAILCRAPDSGDDPRSGHFFQRTDGSYAIPGTSLRGMLRNVVEIAGFSRLAHVTKTFQAIRDLHNRFTYGQYMAEIRGRQPVPLVNAGWLRLEHPNTDAHRADRANWVIEPCNFAKVEYDYVRGRGPRGYNPGRKQSAVDKYRTWCGAQQAPLTEAQWADIERPHTFPVQVLLRGNQNREPGRLSDFGAVGQGRNVTGRLVFTGQPSEFPARNPRRSKSGQPKHHDFLFYGNSGRTLPVDDRVKNKFLGAHRGRGQQDRNTIAPNDEWAFWRARLRMGGRVPVFFLMHPERPGELWAVGLAMMFRLAYDNSPYDLAQAVHADAWNDPRPDLAEALFGHVLTDDRGHTVGTGARRRQPLRALRGRVSIGDAVAQTQPRPERPIKVVLSAPKPSYYPNYITQGARPGSKPPRGRSGPEWVTYMNRKNGSKPRLRGWKRYAARTTYNRHPELPPKAGDDSKYVLHLHPLPQGTTFKARVRVHNLRPAELGALFWALDFGGADGARHQLGQGRPLGLGNCTLRMSNLRLRANSGEPAAPVPQQIAQFVGFMNHALGTPWAQTEQIRALVGLATPEPVEDENAHYRYPQLEHPYLRNEFTAAKKQVLTLEAPRMGRTPTTEGLTHVPMPAARSLWGPPEPGDEAPIEQAAEAPEPEPEPEVRAPLPLTLRVRFADRQVATERRRIYAKQAKKKKIKPFHLAVLPMDAALRDHPDLKAGLVVSTTETEGIREVFRALADDPGGLFEFYIERTPDTPTCPRASVEAP